MQNQPYANFWQRIHQSAKDKGFPLRVMFELTYQCNFKCKHCYVPQGYRKKGELKTKEVFAILDQLKAIGCFYLGFTGGEPFMRKDIMQILSYAKKKGFEIIIYSNGSLINEKMADELADLRPNKVDITIPGMSKNAFEAVSGLRGSRDKVFAAIGLLHKKGVGLGFKTCVLKENEGEIRDIQEFSASLGALHRLDDMLSARLDGSEEPYKYRGQLPGNREQGTGNRFNFKKDTDCNFDNDKQKVNNGGLFKCGVGMSQAAITPQGELKMCLMIDYPRYKIIQKTDNRKQRTDLKDAWLKMKNFVSAIKADGGHKCNQCNLQMYCKWCPARGWLYNKDFTSCEPETRRKAESIMEEVQNAQKTKIQAQGYAGKA